MLTCRGFIQAILSIAYLAGCAGQQLAFHAPATSEIIDESFAVTGRLSINMAGRGQVAKFDWQHTPSRDELEMNTPLGTTAARLVRDVQGVTLQTSDGRVWHAPDVETLTQQRLGWVLPMSNLVWWVRGRQAPGVAATIQADGSLLQQGWTIRFLGDGQGLYPKRVDLSRDDLSLRLVLQAWR